MGASLNTGFKKAKVQPEMNVTPLVDVVLVLLIIFMVLAPVMAKSFWVRLPPKDDKEEQLDQANDPDKPLVLSVAADGKTAINKIEVDRAELTDKLTRMFNARPDNSLYLDAADDTEYGMVLGAVDLARGAQAFPIVILTSKPE
ncbi:biopolymer transporter ExbD [Nannocystis pusilla]|uniref:Biopolymer transporter ExbD n=1 Tax=Nannocystis pusilla TaxID=889268 RepID=A0A9X3EXE3_9BACT|nr:biopolymer transporter ExbD [Nannocystis pusilla]MCY1011115.1 biopolymer transporter ExbD [Nannocystis pusilla]